MTGIEVIRPPGVRRLRAALFDFDGTLSLIREGWQNVMIPMMVEDLARLDTGLSPDRLRAMMADDVAETTGLQTIYQMIRFAQRVAEFGGTPLDPKAYKAEYNRRLLAHIAARRADLASGKALPDSMLLPGSRAMLEALAARGLVLCLVSGTDQPDVREEARLLDVARYFGPNIHGALDDCEASSKKRVLERLLAQRGTTGDELVVFGDGFVEIENVKEAGGYAVGVASDEETRGGRINPWKRERLIRAGADIIIPDFAGHADLAALLLPGRP
ncbi:MAG: HAD hydrolase-like protein [Planctomycetota bacterium]|nr:HAD hydrolase-like protein [Planctomycetota bacterium]